MLVLIYSWVRMRQIGVNETAYASKAKDAQCGDQTLESWVQYPND